ncbi:hypothetical protein DL89DRAFT_307007 [Linderina pennispora]|uniref:Uncharacterized protein n=1 Tax=Linderina pennispora TaxID=61395 RepID=A0A1Y1VQY8_9FUNG|nr:uncharacterized protein DL89DRAFT_307007 [Linderina pennispora]ORX63690.1 hypothetical protein DL89DRAFT_307007 [Linderina pennispora]
MEIMFLLKHLHLIPSAMLTHRKNWCRICANCLTCPRANRSRFHQGRCHCEERSINHVSPQKVKGEQLLSFRYRQISADDIDIFNDIWPRFRFVTPPLERNLLRANICSTCQQRLRRARLARNSHLQGISKGDSTEDEGIVLSDEEEDPAQVYHSTRPASRVGSFGSSDASGWTPRAHPTNAAMSPIQYPNSSLRSTISQNFANQPLPEMIAAPIGSLPRPTVGQSDTCRWLGAVQTPSSLHVGDRFPACKGYECRTEVPDSGGTEGHSATAVAALAQMRYTQQAAGLPATPAQAYEVEECNSDDDQDVASADELDITHVETPNQVMSLPGVSSLLMGINAPNKRSAPGANSLEFLAKWPICNRGMSLARGRSR